jgi:hypothetical protein
MDQILEDMLRACVIQYNKNWDKCLALAEFSYNNSYQSSLKMAPFEALYGHRCRTPLGWPQTSERKIFGPDLVTEAEEKVKIIQSNLKAAQSRQKSYVDKQRKPLQFEVGDFVYLKVSPTRGVQRFGMKGKIAPRYVGPFEILEACGPVAYRLQLPPWLAAIHNIFHVSQLKKCIKIPTEVINFQTIKIDSNLSYNEHPIRILDTKERSKRRETIRMFKIQWNHHTEKKRIGKLNLIFSTTFQTSLEPNQVSNLPIPFYSGISGRDSF